MEKAKERSRLVKKRELQFTEGSYKTKHWRVLWSSTEKGSKPKERCHRAAVSPPPLTGDRRLEVIAEVTVVSNTEQSWQCTSNRLRMWRQVVAPSLMRKGRSSGRKGWPQREKQQQEGRWS